MLLPLMRARGLKAEELLPLDGAGWFAGDVIDNPVYAINLVNNPAGDGFQ